MASTDQKPWPERWPWENGIASCPASTPGLGTIAGLWRKPGDSNRQPTWEMMDGASKCLVVLHRPKLLKHISAFVTQPSIC